MEAKLASVKGVYSRPEDFNVKTARFAALEVWEADLAVLEAEEDEAVGYGYDPDCRARLARARKQYREMTGKEAPKQPSSAWLVSHK